MQNCDKVIKEVQQLQTNNVLLKTKFTYLDNLAQKNLNKLAH